MWGWRKVIGKVELQCSSQCCKKNRTTSVGLLSRFFLDFEHKCRAWLLTTWQAKGNKFFSLKNVFAESCVCLVVGMDGWHWLGICMMWGPEPLITTDGYTLCYIPPNATGPVRTKKYRLCCGKHNREREKTNTNPFGKMVLAVLCLRRHWHCNLLMKV